MSENFIYIRGRVVHRAASPPRDSSAQVRIFDAFVSDLRMLWAIVGKKLPMTRWSFSRGQRVFFFGFAYSLTLINLSKNGSPVLHGFVSDPGCGSSYNPTVYMNVSSVIPWMKQTIENVYGKPIKLLVC